MVAVLDRIRTTVDVSKILIFATLIDAAYQMVVFRWVYPGEALLVAVLLAFVSHRARSGQPDRAPMAAAARSFVTCRLRITLIPGTG